MNHEETVGAWSNDVMSDDEAAENNRHERNYCLQNSDWTQLSDIDQRTKYAYVNYRQALRDITSHENWPNLTDEDWPTIPNI